MWAGMNKANQNLGLSRCPSLFLLSLPNPSSPSRPPTPSILGSLHSTLLPLLTPSPPHPSAPPRPRRRNTPSGQIRAAGIVPPADRAPDPRRGVRGAGAPGPREPGDDGGGEHFRGGRSADPGARHGLLGREGERRLDGSGRAPRRRRAQGLHRVPHHQDPALARGAVRTHVALQRVRDPVPEEETGGDGPRRQQGRRRRRAPAPASAEEEGRSRRSSGRLRRRVQEGEGKGRGGGGGRGHRGAPHGGVRQGGGAEAAAADAPEEAPRRGGARGHPAHGPLLRRRVRLTSSPNQPPRSSQGTKGDERKRAAAAAADLLQDAA